jgi:predicted phage gp36 major capsid-like protein
MARVIHKLSEAVRAKGGLMDRADALEEEATDLRRDLEGDNHDLNDQSEAAFDKLVCANSR